MHCTILLLVIILCMSGCSRMNRSSHIDALMLHEQHTENTLRMRQLETDREKLELARKKEERWLWELLAEAAVGALPWGRWWKKR